MPRSTKAATTYFGVTPAVLLFWPFAAVTGHDLPEATGALVFMILGFGLATAWWLDVRRTYFPRLAWGWTVSEVVAIGLCSADVGAEAAHVYEVAIGSGYAFSMLALWAATRAWRSPTKAAAGSCSREWRWGFRWVRGLTLRRRDWRFWCWRV